MPISQNLSQRIVRKEALPQYHIPPESLTERTQICTLIFIGGMIMALLRIGITIYQLGEVSLTELLRD